MYENYVSNDDDNRHAESYNPEFNFFFNQHLDELENISLINEWTINMDKDSYNKQAKQCSL